MNAYDTWAAMPWRLWDDLLGGLPPWDFSDETAGRHRYPRVNAWERDDELLMEAMIPGLDPGKVEVCVEGHELTLRGEQPQTDAEGKKTRFERRFELPFAVDAAKVKARCRNGILTLALPKAAGARKQTIAIEG